MWVVHWCFLTNCPVAGEIVLIKLMLCCYQWYSCCPMCTSMLGGGYY